LKEKLLGKKNQELVKTAEEPCLPAAPQPQVLGKPVTVGTPGAETQQRSTHHRGRQPAAARAAATGTPVQRPAPRNCDQHPCTLTGTPSHSGRWEGAAPPPPHIPFPGEPQLSTASPRARREAQTSRLSPAPALFLGDSHPNGSGTGSEGCPCARAGTFPALPRPRNHGRVPSLPPGRPSGQVTLRWLCSLAQLQLED